MNNLKIDKIIRDNLIAYYDLRTSIDNSCISSDIKNKLLKTLIDELCYSIVKELDISMYLK